MHLESIAGIDPADAAPEQPVDKRARRLPLSRAELVADDWSAQLEAGYRLYRLFPKQNMYGLARYERDVDGETGELVEEETLVEYGFATVEEVYVPGAEDVASDFTGASRLDANDIRDAYRDFGTSAVEEALHEGAGPLEILGRHVSYAEHEDVMAGMIEHDGPDPADADRRLDVARSFAAALHPDGEPAGDDAVYYVARLGFDDAPLWYLRAAELHLNGVLKNRPTVALVQAMSESDSHRFETQEDIADALGLTQGTVSKHLDTAEEWMERAEWHAQTD